MGIQTMDTLVKALLDGDHAGALAEVRNLRDGRILFGRFLDVVNAQQIGLLPVIAHEHVKLCGNTALAGF